MLRNTSSNQFHNVENSAVFHIFDVIYRYFYPNKSLLNICILFNVEVITTNCSIKKNSRSVGS